MSSYRSNPLQNELDFILGRTEDGSNNCYTAPGSNGRPHAILDQPVVVGDISAASMLECIRRVRQTVEKKTNTGISYLPKRKEFMAFCDHVFRVLPMDQRYSVTKEKVIKFLVYQAFREQKKRGRKKKMP